MQVDQIRQELRKAREGCERRGLEESAEFVSELLISLPPSSANQQPAQQPEDDFYWLALNYFRKDQYKRCISLLGQSEAGKTKTARFLGQYALYLAGEKQCEEQRLESDGNKNSNNKNDPSAAVSVVWKTPLPEQLNEENEEMTNPYLSELRLHFGNLDDLDGYELYLYGVVLKKLNCLEEAALKMAESVEKTPALWSAWVELAALSPHLAYESPEDQHRKEKQIYMYQLFQAHVFLKHQQTELALQVLSKLNEYFGESRYLLSQRGLVHYHRRDFDAAELAFGILIKKDPYRLQQMDVYSNILYVKESKPQLSELAQRLFHLNKYAPETCCVLGNYYSLKGKHARALLYFQRALALDPEFLSAWTLIGHEYVELKNPPMAIRAYRQALQLEKGDYRAWYGLGQTYEILQMYLYGLYYYTQASQIRPYDSRMWCALAGCYQKLNKRSEAIRCYERAMCVTQQQQSKSNNPNPGNGNAALQLAQLYASMSSSTTSSSSTDSQKNAAEYYQLYLNLTADQQHQQMHQQMRLESFAFLARYHKSITKNYARSLECCQQILNLTQMSTNPTEKEEARAIIREINALTSFS